MFSKKNICVLQEIIRKNIPYKSKSAWLIKLNEDTGIGTFKAGEVSFNLNDIKSLSNYLVINGFPTVSSESDFNDRIEAARHVGNEKITTNSVTHDRVLALFPNHSVKLGGQTLPKGRAMDLTIEEALTLNNSEMLVIENLAPFLNAQQYDNLTSLLPEDCVVVFRGMSGCYSSKAVIKLLSEFRSRKTGWFDFDPAGLALLGHDLFDCILLPNIDEMKEGLASGALISDPQKFYGQNNKNTPVKLERYKQFMQTNKLGMSQEYMFATNLKLDRVLL
jgi:hypothetical protein